MQSLGRRYGQALQLINILRDAGADLRAGRCYLPEEDLRAAGTGPDRLARNPTAFATVFTSWLETASSYLEDGLAYAQSISNWRVRMATALPALIGARTLALLLRAGAGVLETRVKVSRRYVRRTMLELALTRGTPRRLDRMFHAGLSL